MASLRKDLRSQLEKAVLAGRRAAEAGAREALGRLGVGEPKAPEYLQPPEKALRNQLRARGRQAGDVLDDRTGRQPVDHLVTVVGYEHWHRMLFARFLAENGLLLEPEHQVAVSLSDVEELAREARTDIWDLAGRFAQRMLPAVFRPDDPVLALALPPESRQALEKLVGSLPREVFLADDSLGWTYQFWQAQRKAEVNESGVKIGADELSPVTQLFTEDYMVEFLLHNTLGAWHAGKILGRDGSPQPSASATEADLRRVVALPPRDGLPGIDWTYLRFVQKSGTAALPLDSESSDRPKTQNPEPKTASGWTPAAGTFPGWPKTAAGITVLDPCMGSGHFLVFALPILARLRMEEENLSSANAVAAVARDNLFGLELDERCTQIAAFNLALAAWKLAGWQPLPPLHLACSGLSVGATKEEWLKLADRAADRSALAGDPQLFGSEGNLADNLRQNLRYGMEQLHGLFRQAPVLGSLIDPRRIEGEGLRLIQWDGLSPLLEEALGREESDPDISEIAVTAKGTAKAAEILAGRFVLVITNVPYLARGKQDEALKRYAANVFPDAKADLATCFVERCLGFCAPGGSTALVTPQNWLFLGSYKHLRQRLLEEVTWDCVVRIGEHGFDSSAAAGAFTALFALTRLDPDTAQHLAGLDASADKAPSDKAATLAAASVVRVSQKGQLGNPDARVALEKHHLEPQLSKYCSSFLGLGTGDYSHYGRCFWEFARHIHGWAFQQGTVETTRVWGGCEHLVAWDSESGRVRGMSAAEREQIHNQDQSGQQAWRKCGVAVGLMRELKSVLYTGEVYEKALAVLVPNKSDYLPAIFAFCSSSALNSAVRKLDQNIIVANGTLVKVPFDLAHWQKVADEKYPNGLPKPYSSDPTQWLFNGHPKDSDQPLHVALARLLGYRWPRQTGSSFPDCPALGADGLEPFADQDEIVCLSSLRGEPAAAGRLRSLVLAALGSCDEHALIAGAGGKSDSLEEWLRDEAFEQHCKLFHHRPFLWHIWDGRPDGFHAFVNYHRLAAPDGAGRKLLETLAFSYLGDWIRKQQDDAKRNEAGAEDRLIAAQVLQKELEAILAGEPPYDLFVRWKPLHQQPIGWEPDLNDGVRLNIRPFLLAKDVARRGAGLLRWKPNIKWEKDRGTEPARAKEDFPWFWGWSKEAPSDFPGGEKFDGSRWNACHYTGGAKRAARDRKKGTEST